MCCSMVMVVGMELWWYFVVWVKISVCFGGGIVCVVGVGIRVSRSERNGMGRCMVGFCYGFGLVYGVCGVEL